MLLCLPAILLGCGGESKKSLGNKTSGNSTTQETGSPKTDLAQTAVDENAKSPNETVETRKKLVQGKYEGPIDWPQWRGPRQDGISLEKGLLVSWPEKGPTELWRIPLGTGFSAVSVLGDKAYTMFGTDEGEYVVCVNVSDGKILWKTRSAGRFKNEYGDGPRSTPTLDEDKVYTLGASGALLCLDSKTGEKVWGFNVLEKFGTKNLDFGLSASPVVIGNMLIVVAGGQDEKDQGAKDKLAALDKKDGSVLWTSLGDQAGYATPLPIVVDGTLEQIVVLTGKSVVGVSPKDGKEFWRHPWITTLDANAATPIFHKNRLFISSGYSTGCAMFELSVQGGAPTAKVLWSNKKMKNYFSTSVLLDGYLYGFNNTVLTCMDFKTGETQWRQRGFNRGSVLAADGKLIIFGERGKLALAEVSPKEYREISKFQMFEGRCWSVPTLSGGKLFIRNEKELVCLDLVKQ